MRQEQMDKNRFTCKKYRIKLHLEKKEKNSTFQLVCPSLFDVCECVRNIKSYFYCCERLRTLTQARMYVN